MPPIPPILTLPLFPLNVVLFPGISMRFHVFEPRYRIMIRQCLTDDTPFGIVCIKDGQEAGGSVAVPHQVGCTVKITRDEVLDNGRHNITIIGENRFEIDSIHQKEPYLEALVRIQPITGQENFNYQNPYDILSPWIEEYLDILTLVPNLDVPERVTYPLRPVQMLYLAAALLQIPLDLKQKFLEINSVSELIISLSQAYKRETAFLRTFIAREKTGSSNYRLN